MLRPIYRQIPTRLDRKNSGRLLLTSLYFIFFNFFSFFFFSHAAGVLSLSYPLLLPASDFPSTLLPALSGWCSGGCCDTMYARFACLSLSRCVVLSSDDVVIVWLFVGGLRLDDPLMVLVVDVEIRMSSPSVSLLRIASCCSFER